MAFCKRKIKQSVQQIGFSHSIVTEKAIDFGRKREFGFFYIFEIQYGNVIDKHVAKVQKSFLLSPKKQLFIPKESING
jgi:hypothetical protein